MASEEQLESMPYSKHMEQWKKGLQQLLAPQQSGDAQQQQPASQVSADRAFCMMLGN